MYQKFLKYFFLQNLKYFGYFFLYFFIIFATLETSLRLYFKKPIFKLVDYRINDFIVVEGMAILFDDDIGWLHKPYYSDPSMNFLEYGIRSNGDNNRKLNKGNILVSGSSFTAGSGLYDNETWPAYLEKKINTPVYNAAVGGFGVDQIIMRAKMLIDVLEPKHVIIDMQNGTLQWSAYSSLGYPKPYFRLQKNELVRYNFPVPKATRKGYLKETFSYDGFLGKLYEKYLGYSFFAHKFMMTFFYDKWLYDNWNVNVLEKDIDIVQLNCALISNFHDFLNKKNILLTVVSIPSGQEFEREEKGHYLISVEECLNEKNIKNIDFFDDLIKDVKLGKIAPNLIWKDWGNPPRAIGHPEPTGNKYFSEKIANHLIKRTK